LDYWIFSNNEKDCMDYVSAGVNNICIDIETRGKQIRQSKRNTFISDHKLEDIIPISRKIGKDKVICRVNSLYDDSKLEIEKAIEYGAGTIMVPYFKELYEINNFLSFIKGRVKVIALVETIQSFLKIEEISKIEDIDRIHIGLNDLSLDVGFKDMFEIVRSNWMEIISRKIDNKIKFGFGGISTLRDSKCLYPVEKVLDHHKKSGSSSVILSRSFERFCESKSNGNKEEFWRIYRDEIESVSRYLK